MSLTRKFLGRWNVKKIISGDSSFIDIAQIQRGPDGFLSFFEQGHLCSHGHELSGSFSRYFFEIKGARLDVHYASEHRPLYQSYAFREKDGGLFAGPVEHVCQDDVYVSFFSFLKDGQFIWAHDVKGPRKNYSIWARYERVA